jgi:restriction system protein
MMAKKGFLTKKDIRYFKKNPEMVLLVFSISGIILGYLQYGLIYYVFGFVLLMIFLGFYGYQLYLKFIKEKKKQEALIKYGFNNLEKMNGYEFEEFIAKSLNSIGYRSEVTKGSGDYGADIISQFKGTKIAIQTKHYKNKVDYKAVQEALSGKNYYKCHEAWVVTSSSDFTRQAKKGAEILSVKLFTLGDFALLLEQQKKSNKT